MDASIMQFTSSQLLSKVTFFHVRYHMILSLQHAVTIIAFVKISRCLGTMNCHEMLSPHYLSVDPKNERIRINRARYRPL